MSELQIIVPTGIALRRPIFEDDAERVAAILPAHVQLLAAEHGRATAVVVKGNVSHFIISYP